MATERPFILPPNLTYDGAKLACDKRGCGITSTQRDACLELVIEYVKMDPASLDATSPRSLGYWLPLVLFFADANHDIPPTATRNELADLFARYLGITAPNKRRIAEAVRHAEDAQHIAVHGKFRRCNLYRLTGAGRRRAANLIRGAELAIRRAKTEAARDAAKAAANALKAMQAAPVERNDDGDVTGYAPAARERVQRITSGECGTSRGAGVTGGVYVAWDNGKVTWEQCSELQPEPESNPEPAPDRWPHVSPDALKATLIRSLERETARIRNQIIQCEGGALRETVRYLRGELRGCEYLLASARDGELMPAGGSPRPASPAA